MLWAFDPRLDCVEFNLGAEVLPGPMIYLEVRERAGENALLVSPGAARLMLAMIEFGLSAVTLGVNLVDVDSVPFTRAECRAIQRVLYAALEQVGELGR